MARALRALAVVQFCCDAVAIGEDLDFSGSTLGFGVAQRQRCLIGERGQTPRPERVRVPFEQQRELACNQLDQLGDIGGYEIQ